MLNLECFPFTKEFRFEFPEINQPTVVGGSEAGVDLFLMQPFLLSYVNHVVLMLASVCFQHNFHKKRKGVCIKTGSPPASNSYKGQGTLSAQL